MQKPVDIDVCEVNLRPPTHTLAEIISCAQCAPKDVKKVEIGDECRPDSF